MPYLGNSPANNVRGRFYYTATAAQTVFSGADSNGKTLAYQDGGYVDVYLNGVLLQDTTDYTATTKTSVTLTSGATAGDLVEIVAYGIFSVADTVSALSGGTFEGAVVVNNNFTVDNGTIKLDGNYPVGSGNVALGDAAGDALTTGGDLNTFVGSNAGSAVVTGDNNTAIGAYAFDAGTGSYNTSVGSGSLGNASNTGSYNTAVGYDALQSNTTASNNTAVGYQAGFSGTTSAANTLIGKQAGYSLTTANGNTFIGSDSGDTVTTGQNNTVLGRYNGNQGGLDIRTASNCIVLSDGDGNPRLYINSSGHWVTQGATPQGAGVVVDANYTEIGRGYINICRDDTATINTMSFGKNGSIVGSISTTGSATAYNTSSDYRLKENVVELTGATTRLKQLEPKRFNFIADADTTVDGFLAHEVQSIVPEAITGTHNEVDDEGNPVYQGIDQSKLVPLLTAALQEAITKIETLETANADMLARIEALENA